MNKRKNGDVDVTALFGDEPDSAHTEPVEIERGSGAIAPAMAPAVPFPDPLGLLERLSSGRIRDPLRARLREIIANRPD